ncbi:MAG: ABC transporter permease, partial [Desulfobulbaceae bacterium]
MTHATADTNLPRHFSTYLYRHGTLYLLILLIPPLLWFGIVYLGSLFALLIQ